MGHQIRGAAELAALVPAKTYIHKAELPFVHRLTGLSASDLVAVEGGDEAHVGNFTLKFLHTPGHTPGSQCFLARQRRGLRRHAVHRLLRSRRPAGIESRRHVPQPDAGPRCAARRRPMLYPGHNYADRPHSTIGDEKRRNPLMRLPLQTFLQAMGRG